MRKKKLTTKQRNRVKQNQQKKIDVHRRYKNIHGSVSSDIGFEGDELNSLKGTVLARYGIRVDVLLFGGTDVFPCHLRSNLPSIVTGDMVLFCVDSKKNEGVVIARLPRKNKIARVDFQGNDRIFAANIDLMIIVIAPVPEFNFNMLDRYLAIAKTFNVKPLILINKIDLLPENSHVTDTIDLYHALGYACLKISVLKSIGITEFETLIKEKAGILVGQSGVGKSSLINKLVPEANIKVGAISETRQRGRHTTTTSRLFKLNCGGHIIDAPGVSTLSISNMSVDEVTQSFPELAPYIGLCKFNNCRHQNEPECALQKAFNDGCVSRQRWLSFIHIIKSLGDSSY